MISFWKHSEWTRFGAQFMYFPPIVFLLLQGEFDAALKFDHTHSQFRRLLGFAKLAKPRRDRATTR
jgi:hypothetical protein